MEISFKECIYTFLLLLMSCAVFGQKKLLKQMDTTLVAQNRYLAEYNEISFSSSGMADQLIEPKRLDEELAAACIFFEINKWREKKRKQAYHQHSKLDRMAYLYAQYYKRFRFRRSPDNYMRLKRTLNRVPKYLQLDFTYLEGYTCLPSIVDYTKGSFYYNDELGTSEVDLYWGSFSKEEDFEEEPIDQISYSALAKNVVRDLMRSKSGTLLRSKAYEILAVRVAPVKKRKNKRVIPKVKVIYLIGAYRNKMLNDL